MRFYLFGPHSQKLSLRQKGVGLIYTFASLANILTTLALVLLPLVLLSGYPLVVSPNTDQLRGLLLLAIAYAISEWIDDCTMALITGYKIAVSEGHATYWIAPCRSSFLPA